MLDETRIREDERKRLLALLRCGWAYHAEGWPTSKILDRIAAGIMAPAVAVRPWKRVEDLPIYTGKCD